MDWAVKSARKKTRFIQGGSRSIVESLNRFNEVLTEGQDAISAACLASTKWLDNEMLNMGFGAKQHIDLVSSEKIDSNAKIALEESTPRKSSVAILHRTPESKSSVKKILSNPVNNSEGQEKLEDIAAEISAAETITKNHSGTLKSSPWSPYKSERATLARDIAPPQTSTKTAGSLELRLNSGNNTETYQNFGSRNESQNVSQSPLPTQSHTAPLSISSEPTTIGKARGKQLTSVSEAVKTDKSFLRDRSQRRSNMFVPLPDKDPLILHSTTSTSFPPKGNSGTLKKPDDGYSTKNLDLTVSNTHSATKSTRPTFNNVFDRLSSKSTRSFDNKASSRSPIRESKKMKPSRLSYRDITGSPKERKSPKVDHTNRSIQETLKNIFDSQIPMLPQSKKSHNDPESASIPPVSATKRSSLIPKLSGRTAVSPNSTVGGLLGNFGHGASNNNFESSPSKKVTSSSYARTKRLNENHSTTPSEPFNDLNANHKKTRVSRHDSLNGELPIPNANPQKAKASQPDKQLNAVGRKRISLVDCVMEESDDNMQGNSLKPKQAQDRLTKFQLPPLAGSEKQDVKKKLDKRLSEVMRSQKEHQKRHHEILKRKSNIEEDLKKRKSRIIQDCDIYKTTKSFYSGFDSAENNSANKPRNTILYDLNSTDHRQMINGAQEETNAGDTTLPDIDSDSDAEEKSILAPWAQSPFLQEQLLAQQNWDPEKIFGPIPPLHTDEIFQNSRLSKLKSRQSLSRSIQGTAPESKAWNN
ncbi:LANO_0E09670g1_1 [Lachancea nothofagi CBS 11611]|uniref:LANO_0E09670g1_1 n=1 Tax=Lachancea nothofagi CBS 11611 TaxID=1266666 RepID=A0A1G4JVZ4_9SACH|nr:LANO_0E09670g1_1 [Lachancea nothofagi CBS 11611]